MSGDVPQSQNVDMDEVRHRRPGASTGQGRNTDALSSVTYKTVTCAFIDTLISISFLYKYCRKCFSLDYEVCLLLLAEH